MEQLAICGVGLIGGSVAQAARKHGLAQRIVAIDPGPATPGVADEWLTPEDEPAVDDVFGRSSLIVLATPVHAILEVLPRALGGGAVVTDCGSTKRAVASAVAKHPRRDAFVPGHPMAGHPAGGLSHASPSLFEGRRWILCPEHANERALHLVESFVSALGADVVTLPADDHDRFVAITSHVPQLVASALATLADETGAEAAAGPGFASATRVAGGAEGMWRAIFETNADAVAAALRSLGGQLLDVSDALAQDDPTLALELLARARRLRGH